MRPYFLNTSFFIGITLFSVQAAEAQDKQSYIVTNHNDTLKCIIKKPLVFDDFGNGYKYRLTKKDPYKPLSADSVKAYYLADDSLVYYSELLPGNKKLRFVCRLEHGKIDLYQDRAQSSVRNILNTWYACKNGSPLLEVKTEGITIGGSGPSRDERKKALADLLADNPTIFEHFSQKNDFGFKAILEVIQQYNTK